MTELTLRDGMVIVGSLLILAVAIDAWRRMRQQQRATVRLKLANSVPEDAPAEDLSLFRELPNGGARVVVRESRDSNEFEAEVDVAGVSDVDPPASHRQRQSTQDLRSDAQTRTDTKTGGRTVPRVPEDVIDETTETDDAAAVDATVEAAEDVGTNSGEIADADDPHDALSGMRAEDDEPANLDWLEDLPAASPLDESEEGVGSLARDPQTEVIVLHVTARDELGFSGKDILEILLACDLRFGDMNFFHRHEQPAGRGPIQFSVANMLQPGVFDIDNMEAMHTRGLVFFLTLPGPEDMAQAFEYMLETARAVARNLTGDLLDESRSVLTQQSIEHSKQQIRELERRLLTSRA